MFEKIEKNRRICTALLTIIIFLQIMTVGYYFFFEKEGIHSDEMFHYGYSNSYYLPHIESVGFINDYGKCNIWVDGSIFGNYLTVQENERFAYGSVWQNQVYDMHPPFSFAIMHTLCSLFPNTYSRWFAFIINVACIIIGQMFFYKASVLICRSKYLAIISCCFWGFSMGFINLNIFMRMYSMLTMFGIMYIYYHARLYYSEGTVKGNLIKLAVVTILGSLTHHYFLVAAFGIAACFCFYYLFKKQFKLMFAYALSVGGGVLLSIAAFPAMINHMFFSEEYTAERLTNKMPFINGFRSCISVVLNSLCGIYVSSYSTGLYAYVIAVLVVLLAVSIPLAFLFRNEEWFRRFAKRVVGVLKYFFGHIDFMFLFLFVGIVFSMAVVSYNVNINIMISHLDRYLFVIFPWAALLLVLTVKYILKMIRPASKYLNVVVIPLTVAAIVMSNVFCPHRYVFKRDIMGEGGIETTVNDHSSYVLMLNYRWHMVCYSERLMGCDDVFVTEISIYEDDKEGIGSEIAKMNTDNDCYIIFDKSYLCKFDEFKKDNVDESSGGNDTYEIEVENTNLMIEGDPYGDWPTLDEMIEEFEANIFPGYRLQFYSSECMFGSIINTFKLVPESEYVYVPIVDAYELEKQAKMQNS